MTMGLPGAGPYTALALACRIGPIERFDAPSSLANFWGLAPSVSDSGQAVGRIGSITKQGSPMVRFLLGQMATHVLRKDQRMRIWHRQIKSRRGAKTARVAVMRRIATILWRMLKTGEAYRLEPAAETHTPPRRRTRQAECPTSAPR
jgi:transposase